MQSRDRRYRGKMRLKSNVANGVFAYDPAALTGSKSFEQTRKKKMDKYDGKVAVIIGFIWVAPVLAVLWSILYTVIHCAGKKKDGSSRLSRAEKAAKAKAEKKAVADWKKQRKLDIKGGKKLAGEFDGVFWRRSMKGYAYEGRKKWPPRARCGMFLSKGYYNDWTFDYQRKSKYFDYYIQHELSDDELTKIEKQVYTDAQTARARGLPDANDWESYASIDSYTELPERKLRRKDLLFRHPDLYDSHTARRKIYAKRQEEKRKRAVGKKKTTDYVPPMYSPFIGDITEEQMAKVLKPKGNAKPV